MIKCKKIFIRKSVVYIPYGSFVDGESHDFDFFCVDIDPDLMKKFEKAAQQDGFSCVHMPPDMALWRSVYDYHGLEEEKIFTPDLCDQDDDWGIVAKACIREQLPNIYNFLVAGKVIDNINDDLLLKKFEENIKNFTPYLSVNYRIIRKLSFALLQHQHLERYGKILPSKKAVSNKYPPYKMLIYGDAENPYNIMEGIKKINEIRKDTIDIKRLCKVSYNVKAEKLSDESCNFLIEIAKYHEKNTGGIEGVIVAEFGTEYVASFIFESSGVALCAIEECPEFLFEEVREKDEPVCIENDENAMGDVCYSAHGWPSGI